MSALTEAEGSFAAAAIEPIMLPGEALATSLPSVSAAEPTKGKGKGRAKGKEGGTGTTTKRKKSSKATKAGPSQGFSDAAKGEHTEEAERASRQGSVALSHAGTEVTTPTKKRPGAKGKGRGRGGMRADSRGGSRATSARGSMSAVPGQAAANQGEEAEYAEAQQEEVEEEGEEEAIEDEEEGEEELIGQGLEEDEWHRQEAIQRARSTAMGPLMKAMDEVQQDRYAVYRQSFLHKNTIRRLISHLSGQVPTTQVVSLTAAMGKVFIGEIVESARRLQQEKDVEGPLQPRFLLEAHRLYKEEREVPGRFPPGAPSASAGTGGNGKRRRLF